MARGHSQQKRVEALRFGSGRRGSRRAQPLEERRKPGSNDRALLREDDGSDDQKSSRTGLDEWIAVRIVRGGPIGRLIVFAGHQECPMCPGIKRERSCTGSSWQLLEYPKCGRRILMGNRKCRTFTI